MGKRLPARGIPNDGFSGIFEKTISVSQSGTYQINGRADDGIRVFVNGKKEIDLWKAGVNNFSKNIDLPAGTHAIKIEYFDEKYSAAIKLDITKASKQVVYKKVNYLYTYNEVLNRQMGTNPPPQTDKYRNQNAFIHKDFVEMTRIGVITADGVRLRTAANFNNNIYTTVNTGTRVTILGEVVGALHKGSTKWYRVNYQNNTLYVHSSLVNPNALVATTTARVNIRETASDNGHIFATLEKGTTVNIVKQGGTWHEISFGAWRNAKRSDVEQYLNPNNFSTASKEYYQFLSLKGSSGLSTTEVNNKILAGKGVLAGKASAFSQAAVTHNINEIYLISHALLETGNGTSTLARGILVNTVDGKPVTPRVVYNTYGIGAYDSCAERCGSEYAYKQGWFTVDAAIIGGARFISQNYVSVGQDTLYKMKWNPSAPNPSICN
ncbi:N-acetylglucosaminidase [Bacillus sp. N9]